VCGVNIGKNAATPIAAAVDDYLECFRSRRPARRLRDDQRVLAEH
jgi:hypothetical protein